MRTATGTWSWWIGNPFLIRLASVISLFLAWVLFAELTAPGIVPGPRETAHFAIGQLQSGALGYHVWATIRRVLVAFTFGMSLGILAGVAMGSFRWVDQLLEAWVVAGLTVPRIMLFVVAYLLLGLSESAIIIALVLTITPAIVVQIREGTQALDPKLTEMARVYRRSRRATWGNVILPQLLPHIAGTARSSLSIAWRLVMLGELLGRTNGVGYQIYFYFQMFDMTGVLAYGLTMMVVLALLDLGVMGALHRRAFSWRRRS